MINRYGKKWPCCYPDRCPPQTASENEMDIYRLCKGYDGPDFLDFICDFIDPEKAQRRASINSSEADIINDHGISVYNNRNAIEHLHQSSRYMRTQYATIAVGKGKYGFSKQEGKNKHHFIWWAYADISPMTHFRKVEKGE